MTDRVYLDLTCRVCCIHFAEIAKEEEVLTAAITYAVRATLDEMTPVEAIKAYFVGYHAAGHPPEPQRISEPDRLRHLYGDVRTVPHPFEFFQSDDEGSYCGHGMQHGDFCALSASDVIHSFRCERCRQRGWVWSSDGEPYCGYCDVQRGDPGE
jgi:hypothetical protein